MPKRLKNDDEEEDEIVSNSGEESELSDESDDETAAKSKKKSSKKASSAKPASPQKSKSSDGSLFIIELSKRKRCRVTEFKGTKYVDFREFYEKDDDMLPGKKGLMLNKAEWEKVKQSIKDIDKAFE